LCAEACPFGAIRTSAADRANCVACARCYESLPVRDRAPRGRARKCSSRGWCARDPRALIADRRRGRLAAGAVAIAAAACSCRSTSTPRYVTPIETARVAALKEQAKTDAEVQKILKPEWDRQHEELVRRRTAYRLGGPDAPHRHRRFFAWSAGSSRRPPVDRRASAHRQSAGNDARAAGAARGSPPGASPACRRPFPRHRPVALLSGLPAADRLVEPRRLTRFSSPRARAVTRSCRSSRPSRPGIATCRTRPFAASAKPARSRRRRPPAWRPFTGSSAHAAGAHIIRVCEGTACHVSGAVEVRNEIRRALGLADGCDTDPTGTFTSSAWPASGRAASHRSSPSTTRSTGT